MGFHEYTGRHLGYIGGCSVHHKDIMVHVGDIIGEYIGGCSVNWKDIMSTLGDAQYIRVFNINEKLLSVSSPHMNHYIL